MKLILGRQYLARLAPLLLALGVAWLGYLPWLERAIFGLASSVNITLPIHDNVVIVGVDDNSIQALGRWPWPRELQAQLLDRVTEAGAISTGYNILLTEPTNPRADQQLSEAIARNGRVVLSSGFTNLDKQSSITTLDPLPIFSRHAANTGFDLVVYETNGTVEFCCLHIEQQHFSLTHFSQVVMQLAAPTWLPPKPLADGLLERPYKKVCGQHAIGINFGLLRNPTPVIPALDVLLGRANPELHNKIVLIGLTANGLAPQFAVNIQSAASKNSQHATRTLISGVELNAATLRTLNNNVGLREAPSLAAFAFLTTSMLLMLWLNAYSQTKRRILIIHGFMTLGVLSLTSVILWTLHVWVPVSPLIAGIALSLALRLRAQFGRLQSDALTDPLTQLSNRRAFEQSFAQMLRRALRHQQTVALIMLDIDFFKKYNDLYGHQQGDEALRRLGQLLNDLIRMDSDSAARLGGEEFGILLTLPDAAGALVFAERLRRKLAQENIPHAASPFKRLTVSAGIALCSDGHQSFTELYKAADASLYEAKNKGRDQAGPVIEVNALTHSSSSTTILASADSTRSARAASLPH